ncbi:MAG TPA: hypothetical protein VKR06_03470 [Ktedonosporobacter sp.]|nr:hypothetical protein [Ktedonosporobacter sp.]
MPLADLFTLDLNIGSGLFTLAIDIGKSKALADFLSITISVAGYTISYNLIDFLVILGISIIATVLIEKLARQTTPGGFLGGFLIALIGIWIFITFIPLTWNQDFKIPTTHVPVMTSFIGAVLSILVAHLFKMLFGRKPRPAKA